MKYQESEKRIEDIPVKRNMKIGLHAATPSGYPISEMKRQLTDLGLTCEETEESKLEVYKKVVLDNFPVGVRQIFSLYGGKSASNVLMDTLCDTNGRLLGNKEYFEALGLREEPVNGSWIVDYDGDGYQQNLHLIAFDSNFDYLAATYPDSFTGVKKDKSIVINEPTSQAITKAFETIAKAVCQAVPGGIEDEDLESMISIILGKNQSSNPKDYECNDVLYVYLLKDYNKESGAASAIGVLTISYRIHIKDYTSKSDHKDGRHQDAEMSATARFVSYSAVEDIKRDVQRILNHKNVLAGYDDIPIPPKKVVVYDKQPAANGTVFKTGMPLVAPGNYADTMIFFCPDFEDIGYINNLDSDVNTTYERSVTVGFEDTKELAISEEVSLEMDFEIVKAGVKLGISTTLTKSYSESRTETLSFEVGAGKQAYLYQGVLKSIILRYDPESNSYSYVGSSLNTFCTNAVKTTTVPIINS